jgi:hypothetical protein
MSFKNVTEEYLWPTRVGFYEFDPAWEVNNNLYELSIQDKPTKITNAAERRVRHILDNNDSGISLKQELFGCVKHFLGKYAKYLDPDYCENRALVITDRSFINTHKDNREGDITCVYFLTGSGQGQDINSVGNPRFVLEDATRYFDESRLPFEMRHGYSVNPRTGLAVLFPSYVPHNQHPYMGNVPHVQIVANFKVEIPSHIEEELFD